MNCHFKIANGMAAGQVPDGVAGEKKDDSGLARHLAQLVEGMPLIGRQPVFKKVNVVGHSVLLLPSLAQTTQMPDAVTLTERNGRGCKPVP